MDEKKKERFRIDCTKYLLTKGINDMRNYARKLGVAVPTKKVKEVLIKESIEILLSEREEVWWTGRGAPIKNPEVPESMLLDMERIWNKYFPPKQTEEKLEPEPEPEPIKSNAKLIREDTEDILSTLTEEQKREVNGFLKFLKEWK